MKRPRDPAWDLVWLLPFISGFAFYGWFEWHPWSRATCDAPIWTVVTWIPFLALPPILVAISVRLAGRGWTATIALVVVALFVTALACFVAFFASFVHQHCGE